MDEYSIAAAIATRLGATTPPSGEESIKYASADYPDDLTFFPALIVGLSDMDVNDTGSGFSSRTRRLVVTYPVIFFLDRSDGTPRRSRSLRAWTTALYPRLSGSMMLGGLVTWSEIVSWRQGVYGFAGTDYDGLLLTARTLVVESSGAAA